MATTVAIKYYYDTNLFSIRTEISRTLQPRPVYRADIYIYIRYKHIRTVYSIILYTSWSYYTRILDMIRRFRMYLVYYTIYTHFFFFDNNTYIRDVRAANSANTFLIDIFVTRRYVFLIFSRQISYFIHQNI